jgi:hypothetical protein
MRRFSAILIFLFAFLPSCKFLENKRTDTLSKLKSDKIKIDSILKYSENIIQDKNSTTYKTVKDNLDSLISIQEIPFSESGDWNLILTHYFTQNGLTFAFQKEFNYFNSICTNGIAREKEILFFDSSFQQIEREYRLTDDKNHTLNKDSCLFQYKTEYQIFQNRDQYLTNKKINLR